MRVWVGIATALLLSGALAGCTTEEPGLAAEAADQDVIDLYIVATDESYRPQSLYRFYPSDVQLQSGDMVNLTLKSAGGNGQAHTLVIDELDIRLEVTGEFDTDSVLFEAVEPGTYMFYCDVGFHQLLGMEGTLTIT